MSTDYSSSTVLLVALLGGIVLGGAVVVGLDSAGSDGTTTTGPDESVEDLTTFESAEEYRSYVQRGASDGTTFWRSGGPAVAVSRLDEGVAVEEGVDVGTDAGTVDRDDGAVDGDAGDGGGDAGSSGTATTPRSSDTNVQVGGIDEPDVLETDGEWAYYAGWRQHHRDDLGDPAVIDTSEPAAPEFAGSIQAGERLLLDGDTLLALESDAIYGFDVSDPENPTLRWEHALNHSVETARLADGTVYLVLRDDPATDHPCPVEPMGEAAASIPCTDVYRPVDVEGGDTTYTALAVDAESGAVGDRVSVVGSGDNTVVHVGHDGIYLTYEDSPSYAETRSEYLLGPGSEHLDDQAIERIREIQRYDLTARAARYELDAAVARRTQRLPEAERQETARSLQEGFQSYLAEHQRDLVRTGITRIATDGTELSVAETGEVPGRVLDQFSISERQGYLHVATTVNPPGTEWENDLYTLDGDLEVADSVTGMGTDQRIYSVRYVEDRAYVTTFRQVDPFHVIDVSDPENLQLQGELELPGYSDYLHPLSADRILGIGELDGQVTATNFDVSDPTDPQIADRLQLEDRWTAVSESHHAFLLDQRHGVFFLPGTEGGHVVSFEDGLELETTVETDGPAVRAAYVGDHLYVFGRDELVVLDQTDWSEVERLDLR